jgi:hypothetical protein
MLPEACLLNITLLALLSTSALLIIYIVRLELKRN